MSVLIGDSDKDSSKESGRKSQREGGEKEKEEEEEEDEGGFRSEAIAFFRSPPASGHEGNDGKKRASRVPLHKSCSKTLNLTFDIFKNGRQVVATVNKEVFKRLLDCNTDLLKPQYGVVVHSIYLTAYDSTVPFDVPIEISLQNIPFPTNMNDTQDGDLDHESIIDAQHGVEPLRSCTRETQDNWNYGNPDMNTRRFNCPQTKKSGEEKSSAFDASTIILKFVVPGNSHADEWTTKKANGSQDSLSSIKRKVKLPSSSTSSSTCSSSCSSSSSEEEDERKTPEEPSEKLLWRHALLMSEICQFANFDMSLLETNCVRTVRSQGDLEDPSYKDDNKGQQQQQQHIPKEIHYVDSTIHTILLQNIIISSSGTDKVTVQNSQGGSGWELHDNKKTIYCALEHYSHKLRYSKDGSCLHPPTYINDNGPLVSRINSIRTILSFCHAYTTHADSPVEIGNAFFDNTVFDGPVMGAKNGMRSERFRDMIPSLSFLHKLYDFYATPTSSLKSGTSTIQRMRSHRELSKGVFNDRSLEQIVFMDKDFCDNIRKNVHCMSKNIERLDLADENVNYCVQFPQRIGNKSISSVLQEGRNYRITVTFVVNYACVSLRKHKRH